MEGIEPDLPISLLREITAKKSDRDGVRQGFYHMCGEPHMFRSDTPRAPGSSLNISPEPELPFLCPVTHRDYKSSGDCNGQKETYKEP